MNHLPTTVVVRRPRRLPWPPDRRAGRRYGASLLCSLLCPGLPEAVPVVNVSARGACLSLAEAVGVGDALRIRLSNPAELSCAVLTLRVAHCRRAPGGALARRRPLPGPAAGRRLVGPTRGGCPPAGRPP
jgi:hypothetical protein